MRGFLFSAILSISAAVLAVPHLSLAASLQLGDSGSAVTALQQALIKGGYLAAGSATGYFGPLTQTALQKFQCARGIICTGAPVAGYGIYGPHTQAALGVSAGSGGSSSSSGTSSGKKIEVSGWIPYWRTATGTADALAHLDQFTEINPFGYTLDSQGLLADPMHIQNEPWTSLIAAAKAKGIRVIPTVMWSDSDAIHNTLSNAQKRVDLEDTLATLVQAENFDGIDIDFENKYAKDKAYFSTFLKGLYQRMGKKWVMCTIEARTPLAERYDGTPPADTGIYANDFNAINKYCDRVRLMAYDQGAIDVKLNDAAAGPYIPVSDPKWVESVVKLAAQSISKNKLMIGIPTYGYEYTVRPLTEGYSYDLQWAFNPKYALDLAAQFHLTPVRNSAGELYVAYQPQTMSTTTEDVSPYSNLLAPPISVAHAASPVEGLGTFNIAWWSDAQAVADKVALAKKLGVRGVSIFKIDGGEDPGMWSVLP